MGTRTTKKTYLQVIAEDVSDLFSQLGFTHKGPASFWRELDEVEQGFFLTPNPSYTHFDVDVGVNIPSLDERLDYICFGGDHYPTLLLSRPLGLLRRDIQGERTFYHFATVEQMRGKLPKVYADFVEQAEPWLAGLTTVEAVAKEFHKWRIAPPPTGVTRAPDPFAWAIYGWLLQEAGRDAEAIPWFKQSLVEVRRPRFGKAGQQVPEGTKGARLIPRNEAETRLRELLDKQ